MDLAVKEYDAKIDSKKRVTLRNMHTEENRLRLLYESNYQYIIHWERKQT